MLVKLNPAAIALSVAISTSLRLRSTGELPGAKEGKCDTVF